MTDIEAPANETPANETPANETPANEAADGEATGVPTGVDHVSIDPDDPRVALKLRLLDRATPAASAIVWGDIYQVEGAYTRRCAALGCDRVVLVDSLETPGWVAARLRDHRLDFRKGDFSDTRFMATIDERFEVGVAYDVLLHQPGLLHTLHLMCRQVTGRICIVHPTLEEQRLPNAVVYLPGNPAVEELAPFPGPDGEFNAFAPEHVNHSHWIWGITRSFLLSALAGEGFAVVHEDEAGPLSNPAWRWWGCIAERRVPELAHHWSAHAVTPGIVEPQW
jgi:hypothetical protein